MQLGALALTALMATADADGGAPMAPAPQPSAPARGLDARLRALADQLALPLKRLPGDHRDQRFAIMPLTNLGDAAEQRSLGLVVSDALVTNLARDHRLPIVERAALAKLLDEQALGQSGALDDGQAAAVGKLAGARALIVGSVADAGDAFLVTVRAVDTESAALIEGSAQQAELPKAELMALSASAVVLRSRSGAMFRSVVLPGWGQAYNDELLKAGLVGGAVGTLVAASVTAASVGGWLRFVLYPTIGSREQDKDLSRVELERQVVETRTVGEGTLVAAAVLAGLTTAAWGAGAIDAYLSGTDIDSLDAALARD